MGIILSRKQTDAKDKVKKWIKDPNSKQIYVVAGYAGTGKSTIVNYIMSELSMEGNTKYATFTGKASLVLTRKGCNSETLHSLLYRLEEEEKLNGRVRLVFSLKEYIPTFIHLVVVDEVSMVPQDIMDDLLSFGVKVLCLGDPGQLPPVGEPNRYLENPDIFLDEIHRQAENDPIIYLSMLARTGKKIDFGKYGKNVFVVRKGDITGDLLITADQVICGFNKTRKSLNDRMRNILGFTKDIPMIGDKIICLKNQRDIILNDIPLINGSIGYVTKINDINRQNFIMNLNFRPEYEEKDEFKEIEVDLQTILGVPIDKQVDVFGIKFDFGQAITCHKSQGSEFDSVIGFREMYQVMSPKDFRRWEYTLITRAVKTLVYGM